MNYPKEFEVISNPDSNNYDEKSSDTDTDTDKENEFYSQDDKRFMLELYKENRDLNQKLAEKENEISRLQENNAYLQKSNVFWLCCYVGSTFCTLFSLSYH